MLFADVRDGCLGSHVGAAERLGGLRDGCSLQCCKMRRVVNDMVYLQRSRG